MTGRPWDSRDSKEARALRDRGVTFAAIGRALGRTYEAVRAHLHEKKGTPELLPEAIEIPDTPRRCLRCKVEFMAFGRFNRLCGVCSETAKFLSSSLAS